MSFWDILRIYIRTTRPKYIRCMNWSSYRSWCPDRTMAQARKYIAESQGVRFAEAVILDLKATFEESDPRTPLICLLSMGSDPTNQIEDLAKKTHVECSAISMGQGQEVHARKLIGKFMQTVRMFIHFCI